MKRLILAGTASLVVAAAIAAPMFAAPASSTPSKLIVAMRDPGCHWFYLGGGSGHRKYVVTVSRTGPVTLVNLDEAALIVKGPGATKTVRVGAKLTLTTKGVYRITMVKQAPDDNHLKLTIT